MKSNNNFFYVLVGMLIVILCACEDYDDVDWNDDDDLSTRVSIVGTYQAENRTFQSGCTLQNNHPGYTGTGFMDFGGIRSLVEWNSVQVASAGEYTLMFRYANGSGGARRCAVTVNDTSVAGDVNFDSTNSWSTWRTASIKARLKAGKNKIRVTATTAAGGPNLDKMDIMVADDVATLAAKDFVGHYERTPVENNWHKVDITLESNKLWWKNAAGRVWSLSYSGGVLKTGSDCPYGVNVIEVEKQSGSDPIKSLKFLGGRYFKKTIDNPSDLCPGDPNKTEPGECGCGVPEGTCGCQLDLGHTDYCKECGPCDEGEGDCDDDSHCRGDLVCVEQDGVDYCRKKDDDDSGGVASNSSNTLLVHDGVWKYVFCSGSAVKVSSSSSKKQRWVKRGARSIYNESVGKYLYCPERDGGYAPTECECSGSVENYHQKTSATGGAAPATISLNREIYIAPNNNMNACLKVIRGDQVHSPCAIEPWRNQTCRKDNGDSFSSSEHAKPCYKFRLND